MRSLESVGMQSPLKSIGKPGTFTVRQVFQVIAHTEEGDETWIDVDTEQPDAPITTVLVNEAIAIHGKLLGLAVGAETAALRLEGPQRDWALEVARQAREVNLLPPICVE